MTIVQEKEGISLILHGREQVWAMRAKVFVSKKDITDVRYETEFKDWRKLEVRMPGTAVPGRLVAGSFWTEQGWDFVYIKNPRGFVRPRADNVLVIETSLARYRRIIVSYSATDAGNIVAWFKNK